ncbi:MAG: hypothetical protein ABSE61_32425 [Bradyrhizobium sp.]
MNPKSTDGSQIQSDGVRKASSMRSDDMRTTIRALITANNYLESEVSELMKAVSNDRRIRRQYSCR